MRTFIKTPRGDYIDAATITDLTTTGTSGGLVSAITSTRPNMNGGQPVAAVHAEVKYGGYGTEELTTEEREAREKQADVLAQNLIHAICRADAIAKKDGNGALIHYDFDAARWVITDLGKTAGTPNYT